MNRAAIDIENWLVKPGSLVMLVFGVGLAWRGGIPMFGILQGQNQNWLFSSNVLYVMRMLLVPTMFILEENDFVRCSMLHWPNTE